MSRVSTSTLSTAVPAMPAPMKPEPTTPSRRICRGIGGARRDPVVLLERGGGEEDLHQLAGDVAHRELAEGVVLLGEPGGDPVLQPDAHRLQRGERRGIVAAGPLAAPAPSRRGTPAGGRPACGRGRDPASPPPRRRAAACRRAPAASPPPARCASRMLRGTTSSTRPRRSALAARSLLPVRIMSSAARRPISRGSRWQPPAPGMRPSCTSGRPSWVLAMIGRDAVVAGERQLEPAAETGAVDRRDDRLGQRLDPAHHLLALEAQPLGLGLGGERGELLDVGAGDEGVGLAGDEHHGLRSSASSREPDRAAPRTRP